MHKTVMRCVLRGPRRIQQLPFLKQLHILHERRKAQLLISSESLCFALPILFFLHYLVGWLVLRDAEVVCQLLRRIVQGQTIELGCEIDHISMFAASVAMIVVICHKQARMAVIVEWAKGFSMTVDLNPIPLRCVDGADVRFYGAE